MAKIKVRFGVGSLAVDGDEGMNLLTTSATDFGKRMASIGVVNPTVSSRREAALGRPSFVLKLVGTCGKNACHYAITHDPYAASVTVCAGGLKRHFGRVPKMLYIH